MAELDPDEFQRWSDIYYKASTSLENREKNVDEAAELIEKVLTFTVFFGLLVSLNVLIDKIICSCELGQKLFPLISVKNGTLLKGKFDGGRL